MPAADAEYEEWPFQGFLKRTKIGSETTYKLEFKLEHLPELLELPIPPHTLDISSDRETSACPAKSSTVCRPFPDALSSFTAWEEVLSLHMG